MKHETFFIHFNWLNNKRLLEIRTPVMEKNVPIISMYEVFRNNTYLFSLYPSINTESGKVWEIVEKDRESHLPPGFITVLGNMIDHFYISE
jgi:hypothetical protein